MEQPQFNEWIEHQNALVLGDEKTSHYILASATEEIFDTFEAPADAGVMRERITSLVDQLPNGRHLVNVISVSDRGTHRGKVGFALEGRSAAAKSSSREAEGHAKAMRLQVDTMESQLSNMQARLDAAGTRAYDAEERAGSLLADNFKMLSMANQILLEKERNGVSMIEAQARAESFKAIATQVGPILLQAGVEAYEYFKTKKEKERLEVETLKKKLQEQD